MLNDLALSLAFNEDIIIGITLTYKFEFMAFCEKQILFWNIKKCMNPFDVCKNINIKNIGIYLWLY